MLWFDNQSERDNAGFLTGLGWCIQEEFPRPDGNDTYELLPLFAKLVLNRINSLDGGALEPPCWKRMCAWMQAGFLVRLMQGISLELGSFREWIWGHQTLAGEYEGARPSP
jgi:hypothetical protein